MRLLAGMHFGRFGIPPAAYVIFWTALQHALECMLVSAWHSDLDTGEGVWGESLGEGEVECVYGVCGGD